MTESPRAALFAGRYRFEPVGKDWDKGRSGYTHLVSDLIQKRLGVIKRTEVLSKQATEGLKNEVRALRALKEKGVPDVYDIGQAIYASKSYFYIVIEYIDGIPVEKELDSLSISERIEILTQLFRLLAEAHGRGIVNGDVDLRHLFWRRNKKQLVVIDWGNAKLGVDPDKKTEFAYDLARSAEIIFSLVTRFHPPSTGSITLPNDTVLETQLQPVPHEFRELCKWAPRTASDNVAAPYTAMELFELSKRWSASIKNTKTYRTSDSEPSGVSDSKPRRPYAVGVFVFIAVLAALFALFMVPKLALLTATSSATFISTEVSIIPPSTPLLTETLSPTVILAQPSAKSTETSPTSTEIPAFTPAAIPLPSAYPSPSVYFDNKVTFSSPLSPPRFCWRKANLPSNLTDTEGFYRRNDSDWWLFGVSGERSLEQPVEVDFSQCLSGNTIRAIALNVYVTHLEPERADQPANEFGVFLEGENGQRREYTLWIDKNNKIYLRIRENGKIAYGELVQAVSLANLQTDGIFPDIYVKFPIQIFLEIDNQGFDILYLQDAPHDAVNNSDLKPVQRIDGAVRTALENVQKIGLIGYGGETRVLIWPLVFFEK